MSSFPLEFLAAVLDANSTDNSISNITNSTVPVYTAKDPWYIVWGSFQIFFMGMGLMFYGFY